MRIEQNFNLLHHNTFGMDVQAAAFVEYDSVEELRRWIHEDSAGTARPLLHVGGGSNLLFTGNFPGTVLHSRIGDVRVLAENDAEVTVHVGAGVVWDDFVERAVANGWFGAENLSLIPGEVGAAAVQNIGAYGVEVKDLIVEVECVDLTSGAVRVIPVAECDYGYRKSRFKGEWRGQFAVTGVVFRLQKTFSPLLSYGNIREVLASDCPTARELRDAIIGIRRNKLPDPAVEGNAGSFFMNPVIGREAFLKLQREYPGVPHYEVDAEYVKVPAGWLIEQCGWKGRSLGRAGVHAKQALVLVNRGGASSQEIVKLCDTVRGDVLEKFGIEIRPEVNII